MVITQPTVDDFSDTTVMRVIRKIVNYICNDLVDGINNNDIVSGQFSVQGNQLSGTLTKGDGTTIDIPAATLPGGGGGSDNPYPTAISMTLSGTTLNFNMTMSRGTPITGSVNLAPILEGYATDAEVIAIQTDLQEQIAGIKPTVTVNDSVTPPTISVAINGKSSTANLPSSGGGGWKRYTLDNLPTDFSTSSIVMFELITQIRILSPWPESWNDPVTFELKKSATTASMQTTSVMKCYSGSFGATAPNIRSDAGNVVAMGAIAISVTDINKLNERNTTNQFGELTASMFNGAGGTIKSVDLTWSNISDYIVAIWRYED